VALIESLPILDAIVEPREHIDEADARIAYRKKLGQDLKAAVEAGNEYEAERIRGLMAAESRFDAAVQNAERQTVALQASIDADKAKAKERADAAFAEFRESRITAMTIAGRDTPREEIEKQFDASHEAANAWAAVSRAFDAK
jgi:hypothetical protein